MNEHGFIKSVHSKLDKARYKIWKINDQFQGGVPDAFYKKRNHRGPLVWVEYKYIKDFPKRENTVVKPGISTLQREWLNDLYYSMQCAVVVLGVNDQVVMFTTPEEWTHGLSCKDAKNRATSKADYVHWLTEKMEDFYDYSQHHNGRPEQVTSHAPAVEQQQRQAATEPS